MDMEDGIDMAAAMNRDSELGCLPRGNDALLAMEVEGSPWAMT